MTIAAEDSLEKINFYEVESDFELDDEQSIDGDSESFQDAEQDISHVEPLSSANSTLVSPKVLMHPEDDELTIQTVNEFQAQKEQQQQQQQSQHDQVVPQQQPQQRPQQYLTPWKRDSSSLSLSSDGSPKHHSIETHSLRVFAGNIGQGPLFHAFDILATTTTDDLLKEVVKRFNIIDMVSDDQNSTIEYYIAVQGADGGK